MAWLPPLDVALRPILLPILLWQSIGVRRAALSLPEAAGLREGQSGTGPKLRLLIVGDSSAAGVGAQTQSEALSGQLVKTLAPKFSVTWRLIAKTGATCQSTLEMLEADRAVNSDAFDVAFIALGVNDAVRLRSKRVFLRRHQAVREVLRTRFGVGAIVVPGVPPLSDFPALTPLMRWVLGSHARRLDGALSQALSKEECIAFLPFDLPLTAEAMAQDGYHPNAESYAVLGDRGGMGISALMREGGVDS